MSPSPSLRHSPGRENHSDIYMRGRNLESRFPFKGRDDDLALFNEMQSREMDNFLLHPTDDFDDLLSSRLKSFPDFKLGITIPPRGESSDLLNADGKNDYDWLLTPPETPLFPSLDDEREPVNVVHSDRERSRPISISRSSTTERSQRSSRGSPSPQRLSPSPQSGGGAFRGRKPSSAPHTSANPARSSTPTRRPSPPSKPSTPPPRSSTPPSRRSSVGSIGPSATSASPKIKAWQSNIPGFSLESPPNLRTSLADRPASYIRGSSPPSRTSPSRRGRQSMSPTGTRSISSSHSHDRVSVVSSGDDDVDSSRSFTVNVSDRPILRGVGSLSNSRPVAFPKKPSKTFSPSSGPKRSFDSAMRQMDRKSPQNMFRPLLSSVPTSTFYTGKGTVAHHAMISRNSSVTTSSNASSDQATSGAHDTDEMTSDCVRTPFSDTHDEVFAFDKMDAVIEDTEPKTCDLSSELQHGKPVETGACSSHPSASEASNVQVDENTSICITCGLEYLRNELIETEDNKCPDCVLKERILTNNTMMKTSDEQNATESVCFVPRSQSSILGIDTSQAGILEENTFQAQGHNCSDISFPLFKSSERSHSNDDITEAAGISVLLLKRSNSVKGPLIHARTFNSSSISYDDLPYARDLASSMGKNGSSDEVLVLGNTEPDEDNVPVIGNVTEHDEVGKSQASKEDTAQNMEESVFVGPSVSEEDTELDNQNDQKEIAEEGLHSVYSTSEIELGHSHPSSPRSLIDTVSREDLTGPSAVTCPENEGVVGSDTTDGIIEESMVTVDTILFCCSIIHDLAYTAANIAIEKEKENLEPLQPTITIPNRYSFNRNDATVRTTKAQKVKKRRVETEAKQPLTNTDERFNDENENSIKRMVQNVGIPNNGDSLKPPKLESKCNCTIM